MSLSGLCEVCQTPSVEHTCDRCGQLVCDTHFDETVGVCVECASEVGRQPDPVGQDQGGPDGTDTYQF